MLFSAALGTFNFYIDLCYQYSNVAGVENACRYTVQVHKWAKCVTAKPKAPASQLQVTPIDGAVKGVEEIICLFAEEKQLILYLVGQANKYLLNVGNNRM